jgi:hypothetical protein
MGVTIRGPAFLIRKHDDDYDDDDHYDRKITNCSNCGMSSIIDIFLFSSRPAS